MGVSGALHPLWAHIRPAHLCSFHFRKSDRIWTACNQKVLIEGALTLGARYAVIPTGPLTSFRSLGCFWRKNHPKSRESRRCFMSRLRRAKNSVGLHVQKTNMDTKIHHMWMQIRFQHSSFLGSKPYYLPKGVGIFWSYMIPNCHPPCLLEVAMEPGFVGPNVNQYW